MNISQSRLRYVDVDPNLAKNIFTIVAGAAGWLDTDISGSDVPQGAISIQWICTPTANLYMGAQATNTWNSAIATDRNVVLHGGQTSASHVYLNRSATNTITYRIMGYWI